MLPDRLLRLLATLAGRLCTLASSSAGDGAREPLVRVTLLRTEAASDLADAVLVVLAHDSLLSNAGSAGPLKEDGGYAMPESVGPLRSLMSLLRPVASKLRSLDCSGSSPRDREEDRARPNKADIRWRERERVSEAMRSGNVW